jgi:hypothetical protein
MNNYRPDTNRVHQDNVFSKERQRIVFRSSGDCIATELHYNCLSSESTDVWQCLYKYVRS